MPCRLHRLSALSLPSTAQDQAGQYDWLKQHVGRVSTAVLTGGPQAAIYAASADAGTLAALAPADGRLLWRRVLAEGDAVTRLVAARKQVLTLSAGGTQLTAWDAATGAAAWVADLTREAATDVAVLGRDVVAVSVGSTIKVSKRVLLDQLSNGMPRGQGWLLRVVCNGQRACPTCSAMQSHALIGFCILFLSLTCRHLPWRMASRCGASPWVAAAPSCLPLPADCGLWQPTGEFVGRGCQPECQGGIAAL